MKKQFLNKLALVILFVSGISFSGNAQNNGAPFPYQNLKGKDVYVCGNKLAAAVPPVTTTGIGSAVGTKYYTSLDGINWVPKSTQPCTPPKLGEQMPFVINFDASSVTRQEISNKGGAKIFLSGPITINGKKYHYVERTAGNSTTAPSVSLAMVEGTGSERSYHTLTQIGWGIKFMRAYQHPQNPRKVILHVRDYNSNYDTYILGVISSDGKSFDTKQQLAYPLQAYSSLAFYKNKVYIMAKGQLLSYNLASATDNSKFITSITPTTVISSGYDVKGKFMMTSGTSNRLFVLHNFQVIGTVQLDEILSNGTVKRNLFNSAKINTSVSSTTSPTIKQPVYKKPGIKTIKKIGN